MRSCSVARRATLEIMLRNMGVRDCSSDWAAADGSPAGEV